MRNFTLIIILCLLSFACERKSGRRSESVKETKQSVSVANNRLERSDRSKQSITSKTNRIVYSGSQIFEKYNPAVFMIYTSDGMGGFQGSGFFVTERGIGVSNYHIFKGTTKGYETIKLADGSTYKISEVLDYCEAYDYIVFKVNIGSKKVKFIPISKSNCKVGDRAFAIGSPRGLENTFSSGEISQIRKDKVLQISVPIDHGSSGGALINQYGEVIGITTAGLDESGANLNFAMDISVINNLVKTTNNK